MQGSQILRLNPGIDWARCGLLPMHTLVLTNLRSLLLAAQSLTQWPPLSPGNAAMSCAALDAIAALRAVM
jgi:hypothetical protein